MAAEAVATSCRWGRRRGDESHSKPRAVGAADLINEMEDTRRDTVAFGRDQRDAARVVGPLDRTPRNAFGSIQLLQRARCAQWS